MSTPTYRNCPFCYCEPELIVRQDHEHRVIAEPYPVTLAHTLVAANSHIGSVQEMSEEGIRACAAMKVDVTRILLARFATVACLEFGRPAAPAANLPDSPDITVFHHHHLHLLPDAPDVSGKIRELLEGIPCSYDEIARRMPADASSYLFFEHPSCGSILFPIVEVRLPKHFLRRLVADAVGKPDRASWRTYQDTSATQESLRCIKELFEHEA